MLQHLATQLDHIDVVMKLLGRIHRSIMKIGNAKVNPKSIAVPPCPKSVR